MSQKKQETAWRYIKMEDWLRAEQLSSMTEQEEQQLISQRSTTVKPEHVIPPKCRLSTTIALCLSNESTVFGALQYQLFVADQKD